MFEILDLAQPDTIEEAYRILQDNDNNSILGGCTFLRLSSQKIRTAIDLSKLNLDYIKELDDAIEIGAMATLREVETEPVLYEYFNGVLSTSVSQINGVQFRNIATVGAAVYAKYGFSDLLTPLLALDTEVESFKGGRMPLEKFLEETGGKDILTRIFIKKNMRKAVYHNLRNSAADHSVLNVTVSNLNDAWRIVVGARPNIAKVARKASAALSKGSLGVETIEGAASMTSEELSFGTDMRGTAEYRKEICRVLVKRAISEVWQCR